MHLPLQFSIQQIINLIENCLLSKNIKFERFVEVIIDNNISDNNISDNNIFDNNIFDNNISDNNISDNNISDTNGYYDEVDTVSLLSNDDDTSDVDSIIWESNNNFSDSLVTDTVSYTTRF
ncbi:hypothetical protein [Spiroplasma endosymbiont of Nomada ruficornis]|uniref:hypothetical protein n=1 Tax=Spiroplasma endosymbiont of Nomada ruficornis TaxID=3066325 RepID=UPI00313AACA0